MEPGTPQRTSQAKDSMGDLQLSEAPTGPVQQQQQILKFAIQIYKLRDGEYCLDFQVCRPAQQVPVSRLCRCHVAMRFQTYSCGIMLQENFLSAAGFHLASPIFTVRAGVAPV